MTHPSQPVFSTYQLTYAQAQSVLDYPAVYLALIDAHIWDIHSPIEYPRWVAGGYPVEGHADPIDIRDRDVPDRQRIAALVGRATRLLKSEGPDPAPDGGGGGRSKVRWTIDPPEPASRPGQRCRDCSRRRGDRGWCVACHPIPQNGTLDLRAVTAGWLLDQLRQNPSGVLTFAIRRRLMHPVYLGPNDHPSLTQDQPIAWWTHGPRELRTLALDAVLQAARREQFARWRVGQYLPENDNPAVHQALDELADRCEAQGFSFARQLSRFERKLIHEQRWLHDVVASGEPLLSRRFRDDDADDFGDPDRTLPGLPR